jgi:trans-aconitate 2-methyltransferase
MTWDPKQYLKFSAPRLRPAIDLLARVEHAAPTDVYDIGAGPGNVTPLLRARWPRAHVTGVDESQEMLDTARVAQPDVEWVRADLMHWSPRRPADVLYSNAALHWLGDHEHLFPRLFSCLAPGGVLAVQMPRNFAAPSHTEVDAAARAGPWHGRLEPLLRPLSVAPPAAYYDLLASHAASLDIWESEYLHVLSGENPVKEWIKGSRLKPLMDALDEPERSQFEAEYAARMAAAYPPRSDGHTLLPFRRLFIVATAHPA